VIVTIRRTFASDRMTVGQMSMGAMMCSTLEPPLGMFQSLGARAIPEGQYPLRLHGDDIVVDSTHAVLGQQIQYGLSNRGPVLLKCREAEALFHPAISEAIVAGEDVLLDVINPR
jgi:hypothetical protein